MYGGLWGFGALGFWKPGSQLIALKLCGNLFSEPFETIFEASNNRGSIKVFTRLLARRGIEVSSFYRRYGSCRWQETEGPAIGLDIGTTNSAVAVRREDGRFLVVPPPGRTI